METVMPPLSWWGLFLFFYPVHETGCLKWCTALTVDRWPLHSPDHTSGIESPFYCLYSSIGTRPSSGQTRIVVLHFRFHFHSFLLNLMEEKSAGEVEIQIFFDHWRRTVALFVQRNNSLAASICSQSLRIAAQTFSLFSENLHAWITFIKFQCGFANMIRARSSKQNEVTLGTTREEFLLRRENLTTGEMMVRGQQGEQQREPHATSSQVHVFIDVTSFFFGQILTAGCSLTRTVVLVILHALGFAQSYTGVPKVRTGHNQVQDGLLKREAANRPTNRERLEGFREYLTNGERVARYVVAAKTWGCIRDEDAPVDQGGRGLVQHSSGRCWLLFGNQKRCQLVLGGRERTSKTPGPVWWKAVRTLKKNRFCRLGGLSHEISPCVSHLPRK